MGKREQDTSMEQLLREALSARDRAPQSECFDADVLAAWADGALTGSERSFAEAHAARCARCQAMLASMARTAPEPAAAAPALSIRRWITFLTPLAAGAVALALWFLVEPRSSIVPQPQPPPPGPTTSTAAPPSPTASVSGRVVPTERAAENERKEGDRTQDARSADALRRRDAEAAKQGRVSDAPATANAAPAPAAKPVESPPADPAAFAKVVPEPKRNPEVPPPNPLDEQRLRQPASTPPAPSAPAAGARSAQSADQQVAQSDLKQRQGYLDAVGRQEAGRGAGAGRFRSTVAVPTIAVPGSNVRWRITLGRVIEHSLDGGTTWATQYSAPENTMLVAGVAPSSTVAWIVGTAGAVLQTSDGRTWRRVPFADAVDLISVNASDARTATVATADKRSFLTIDGGATWIERKD